MGINVSRATIQANELANSARMLNEMKNNLEAVRGNLNSAWQAEEMKYVNNAIQHINSELQRISSLLKSLETDIIATAHDIRREEEAEERAAAKKG